MTETV